MASLLDFLRNRLLGQAGIAGVPDQIGMASTQGLFGKGGQFGGGLLQNNLSKMMNEPGGLLQNLNQNIMLGSALYGEGLKGKDPLEGFFPAVTKSAQLKKLMTPAKSDMQKLLESAGYEPGSPEYKAAVENYLNKNKRNTLSQEALNLYLQGKAAGENFDEWYKNLNKADKNLYDSKVKPNMNTMEATLEFIENQKKNLLEKAIPLPIKDGKIDINSLQEGMSYNYNNQLVVFDGEKVVPYEKYMNR